MKIEETQQQLTVTHFVSTWAEAVEYIRYKLTALLCSHSDVQCDSRQLMALSGACLTAIWCDSSHQRVCFVRGSHSNLHHRRLYSPAGSGGLLVCGWLLIASLPSNSFLCLQMPLTLRPNHSLPLAVCQQHHLVSSRITTEKVSSSASISRRILAACLYKSF